MFLDANILFSAAKSDGAMRQLLELLVDAGHECHFGRFYGKTVGGVAIHSPRSLTDKLLA